MLDPLLTTVIDGRYRIEARLARGGMASVYRGIDTRLQRPVALKLIHSHLAEQPDFAQRFIREAQAAAALSNPHIVSIYDQGIYHSSEGERAYLVMELINGPDLRSELSAHGSFTLRDSLEIIRQVLTALAVAHNAGIVHRDVKPENILLSESISHKHVLSPPSYTAKVADFGLARAVSDVTSTHSGQMLGTVAYIAPEIVTRGRADQRADLYALGVMLYELLAGKQPFIGESPVAVAYAHVNDPMPRLTQTAEWMPEEIDSFICALTAKDPSKRPLNASAALDMLINVITHLDDADQMRRISIFPQKPIIEKTEVTSSHTSISSTSDSSDTSDSTQLHASTIPPKRTDELEIVTKSEIFPTQQLAALSPNAADDSQTRNDTENSVQTGTYVTTAEQTHESHQGSTRSKKLIKTLLLMITLIAALSSGIYWWFFLGPGLRVPIPQVAGMSVAEAEKTLTTAGFQSTTAREYSDTVDKDTVIASTPEGGTAAHPSQIITLRISDGVEYLNVPNVVGKTADEAQHILTQARFTASASEDWSNDVPKGTVISQTPEAGESIPHDSSVTYIVSKGREPITVPEIGELSGSDYEKALTDAGFSVTKQEEFSDSVPEGAVISVDPAEGTQLYRGDAVTLTISKGPELLEVPNVVGKQRGEATRILEEAGFNVAVKELLGGYFGTVRLQDTAGGTKAKKGSTITLTIV